MKTDLHIRSTDRNWIVSIRKTSSTGAVANAPVATIPRRAYAAATLAGAVTATQKMFMIDSLIIDTDRVGLDLLLSLEMISKEDAQQVAA